ncbi:MAG: hypothetical protein ACTS4X_02220, partial [Candidatus Hodgkinia cicadicola]
EPIQKNRENITSQHPDTEPDAKITAVEKVLHANEHTSGLFGSLTLITLFMRLKDWLVNDLKIKRFKGVNC